MSFVGNAFDFHLVYANYVELRKFLEGFHYISNEAIIHMTPRGIVIGQSNVHMNDIVNRSLQITRKDFLTYLVPAVQPRFSQRLLECQEPTICHTSIFFRIKVKEFMTKLAECRDKTVVLIWYKEAACDHPCIQFSKFSCEKTTVPISLQGVMEPLFLPSLESLRNPLPPPACTIPPIIRNDCTLPTGPYPGDVPTLTIAHKFESIHYTPTNHYALDANSMYVLQQANLNPRTQGLVENVRPLAFTLEEVFDLLDPQRYPRRFMVEATPLLDQISALNNFNEYTCFLWQQGVHFWLSAFSHDDCGATKTTVYLPRPDKSTVTTTSSSSLLSSTPPSVSIDETRMCLPIAFRYLMLMRSDAYACRHVFFGMNENEMSAIFVTNQQGSLVRHTVTRQLHPRGPDRELHPFGDPEHILSGDTALPLGSPDTEDVPLC